MKPIEMDIWRPKADDPRYAEYVGSRTGVEVFKEVEQRLDGMGLLPDEYLILAPEWEGGKELPRDADIFVTTDYGENEGIYLDAYLRWYEDGKRVTQSFFTGKTLEETGSALDRMFLISSAITKAFHGYGQPGGDGALLCLSAAEKQELVEALVEKRERMLSQTDSVEKLLRRTVGSITAYMDTVGERPLRISAYDKAVLAIHDSELEAFRELLPKVTDHADELLVETAGHAGAVGRKMLMCLLAETQRFSEAAYFDASKRAVEIGDAERVKFLMEQYASHVTEPDAGYYGKVIDRACAENKAMGFALIAQAPDEWIAAAPTSLLVRMSCGGELRMAQMLINKGLQPGADAENVLQNLTCDRRNQWMAEQLLENGMEVGRNDWRALNACVVNGATETAKLLLDQGMDFEEYLAWRQNHDRRTVPLGVIETLTQYAQEPKQEHEQGMAFGGMQP